MASLLLLQCRNMFFSGDGKNRGCGRGAVDMAVDVAVDVAASHSRPRLPQLAILARRPVFTADGAW